ncbi:MAG: ABC transporter permease, partial [Pseudolabrys sp.]
MSGSGPMSSFWIQTLHQAVISGTPLAIAGLGELVAETGGIINLGVEGTMLIGAVSAYGAALATDNVWLGLLCGTAAGALFGMLHALLTVSMRINQIAAGLTLVFLGIGVSGYAGQGIAGMPVAQSLHAVAVPGLSRIPVIGPILFIHDWVVYGTALLAVAMWALLRFSVMGLNLRAAGEDPAAADAAGVPIMFVRYAAVVYGGALAGLAGGYFVLVVAHAWAEQITGGQGWIAIALVIAANWRPLRLIGFALLFGMVDSLYYSL